MDVESAGKLGLVNSKWLELLALRLDFRNGASGTDVCFTLGVESEVLKLSFEWMIDSVGLWLFEFVNGLEMFSVGSCVNELTRLSTRLSL